MKKGKDSVTECVKYKTSPGVFQSFNKPGDDDNARLASNVKTYFTKALITNTRLLTSLSISCRDLQSIQHPTSMATFIAISIIQSYSQTLEKNLI